MERIGAVQARVDRIVAGQTDATDIKFGYVHLYSVSQACALLAMKRQENVELAAIAGLLHDIYAYKTGARTDHAHEGAVLGAVMDLKEGDPAAITARIRELAVKRREKQPLEYASAGSTFKRPAIPGVYAGRLIQDAGLRGYACGDAQVSEKHCGFVINRGGASAAQIRRVIEDVRERVFENSGIRLEREVIYLGEF